MRIHLIAIGGKVMHNLALELLMQGHEVSGSDDEIYDPAYSRLAAAGILPSGMGWEPDRITRDIDIVILGMHAQLDNPELIKSQELGLSVVSFPEYIGQATQDKTKIVICGSHGKSTITAMIMHVLRSLDIKCDYALGGMLSGFDRMVSLTDAEIAVIEGDEYLSSRIDTIPKMMHYHGDIIVITGIAWDHMNVFPSMDNYVSQFENLIDQALHEGAKIIWYGPDTHLQGIMNSRPMVDSIPYDALTTNDLGSVEWKGDHYPIHIFGNHNLANMNAARLACESLGISAENFLSAMISFEGVGRRLQVIATSPQVYLDYAHAPSKVRATVEAVREKHATDKLLAVYELHTYSSLTKAFLPLYQGSMAHADQVIIYYDPHALEIKRLPPMNVDAVRAAFGEKCLVLSDTAALFAYIRDYQNEYDVILMMSSGTFGGMDLDRLYTSQ